MKQLKEIIAAILVMCIVLCICACGQSEEGTEPQLPEESEVENIWEVGYFKDNFGSYTDGPYIVGQFEGTFSNTATSNSDLTVLMGYDDFREEFFFKFYEYNKSEVYFDCKDYTIILQGKTPSRFYMIHSANDEFKLRFGKDDFSSSSIGGDGVDLYEELMELIKDEMYIQIVVEAEHTEKISSKYYFAIDGYGFNEAFKELTGD